jgi:hypothetical protein
LYTKAKINIRAVRSERPPLIHKVKKCFKIEPGVYLQKYASKIVLILRHRKAHASVMKDKNTCGKIADSKTQRAIFATNKGTLLRYVVSDQLIPIPTKREDQDPSPAHRP